MTKKPILVFLLITIPLLAPAQDAMAIKLSKQLCKCLEKNQVTNMEDIEPCFEQLFVKNLKDMYKYYKVETMDELDMDKIGVDIGVHLSKECEYMQTYLVDPIYKIDKDVKPDENLDCYELKNGDFYYVFPHPVTKVNDTTFVTIKDKMYLERMNNGKTYSLLDIQWVEDCQFELSFKNSNDPYKKNLSKEGEIYKYQVMSSTPLSFTIKINWQDQTYKFELFKMQ